MVQRHETSTSPRPFIDWSTPSNSSSTEGAVSPPSLVSEEASIRRAQEGDIVTLDWHLEPEHGFVPEPLFDTIGIISLVIGGGHYLPGLHALLLGCSVGDKVQHVSMDAGWGEHRADLVFRVPLERILASLTSSNKSNSSKNESPDESTWEAGRTVLHLDQRIPVLVREIHPEDGTVVLDANPPLAGASYACSLTVLAIHSQPSLEYPPTTPHNKNNEEENYHEAQHVQEEEAILNTVLAKNSEDEHCEEDQVEQANFATPLPSLSPRYEAATFALGCFWGAELLYMREPGVVGTRVGYSQGWTVDPTYEQVCDGTTQHREAVLVIYDATQVSYRRLIQAMLERLRSITSPWELYRLFQATPEVVDASGSNSHDSPSPLDQDDAQYRHGIYYHSEQQRRLAQEMLAEEGSQRYGIELLPAQTFWPAEDFHQQYLYKGGQSARKGAKETIRCYG